MTAARALPLAPIAAAIAMFSTLAVGALAGLGPGLLVLSGSVLLGAVFLLWSSLERLSGESPLTLEEAIGLGAPTPEEERKRAVLRALKDLEYERSVGKISEEDYAELSARYRAEAKRLLQSLDAELAPLRRQAEERLAKRLSSNDGKRDSSKAKIPQPKKPSSELRSCVACQTENDADARFCKQCAAPLGNEGS